MQAFQASAKLERFESFCNHWGLDLTVGCEHACVYCPFQASQALSLHNAYPDRTLTPSLSIEEFLKLPDYPPLLYLSPNSDPLAPAASANLELVLQRILPLGVQIDLSTKGIVPQRIFQLLASYPDQVRLFIGLTSLDDRRNAAVEPGCPTAEERLANFRLAREHGLKKVTARLDPLLPDVDDSPEQLVALLDRVAALGAQTVTVSYLFLVFLGNKDRLREVPFLGRSVGLCKEVGPAAGGLVFSVPLKRKLQMYEWLNQECAARGMYFGTCGCKDLRLAGKTFSNACSYPSMLACEAPSLVKCSLDLPRQTG